MTDRKEKRTYVRRLTGLGIACVLAVGVLAFNLWRLQIAEAAYYAQMAEGNVVKLVTTPTVRGSIVDSQGLVLAESVPKMALILDWTDLQSKNEEWKQVVVRLAEYLKPYWPYPNQSVELIAEDIYVMIRNQQWQTYQPVVVLEDVPTVLEAIIAEHSNELPGVRIDPMPVRVYPQGTRLGQALGYVREISEDELAALNEDTERDFSYKQGDLIGKMGIEKSFDTWLRGREGVNKVVLDKLARPIDQETIQEPQPGYTIQLTVDGELQQTMEQSLEEVIARVKRQYPKASTGAAVAIEVKTGRILAMVSRPYMDPNDLIGLISDETAARYFSNADAASFNRSLTGLYAPGSVFKMLVGMAALELGVTTPQEQVNDQLASLGPLSVQKQGIAEWGGNHFGWVNLYRAIAKSSNIYFQTMGRRVFDQDPEYLRQIAHEFGLGTLSGIDIPGEATGTAPSPAWKRETFGPAFEERREEKLAAIDQTYAPQLAQAQTEDEREQILARKISDINAVEAEYAVNKQYEVDWRLYDSFNNSIGQGYNSYTLLQLANYVATIANGGTHYKPYLVDKILDPLTGDVVKETQPEALNQVSISPENIQELKHAMSLVTSGEGTAAFVFNDLPQYTGGGKTGTAQVGSKYTTSYFNGMYIGYAPYDDPQIAVAAMVEYGGTGGDTAGRVVKAAFQKYFGW